MSAYEVKASLWKHGWELVIPDVGVTQSSSLGSAERVVRDYLELAVSDVEAATADVTIVPYIGSKRLDPDKIKALQKKAAEAQDAAARAARDFATDMKKLGATGADIAHALNISAQRVSQLLAQKTGSSAASESRRKVS